MGVLEPQRSGRRRLAALLGILAVTVAACSDETDGRALGDETIRSVTVVTEEDDFRDAIDAALTPDGEDVYFTATNSQGPGVFHVPATGGRAVAIATGSPLQGPVGIATDGTRIYVADPEVGNATGKPGAVLSLPSSGGRPTPVPGTEGTAARGLEVVREGDAEMLYFTGRDPLDGTVGVFKIPATGATSPTTVSKGAPWVSPEAVTVTKAGVVYATDRGAADGGGGVFRITPASTTRIADIRAPVLAGVALTLDESLLLVSSLSAGGTDQVLLIDLVTGRTGIFSKTIGKNRAGAGLHRARNANVFAWADVQRPGRVYRLDP
jgi:hypothetical protein